MSPEFIRIKKQYGLSIVAIKSDVLQPWPIDVADHMVHNPKVEEWIGLFQNASFVLTDSFHGTLFSIKSKVPFLNYIGSDTSSERVAFIADKYQVNDGYPLEYEKLPESMGYTGDFKLPEKLIKNHVSESYEFLRSVLEK